MIFNKIIIDAALPFTTGELQMIHYVDCYRICRVKYKSCQQTYPSCDVLPGNSLNKPVKTALKKSFNVAAVWGDIFFIEK